MRVAVKICGLTRAFDVALAASLGAEYLGFNFSEGSPRRVSTETAPALADAAGKSARRVGVFVNETAVEVRSAIAAARLELLQFHRELRVTDFDFGLPVIGVCRVGPDGSRLPEAALLERCAALLFDSFDPASNGGTGRVFAWDAAVLQRFPIPIWVAGGLSAENVAAAIEALRPEAVDVASGVESRPGEKDAGRMTRFFEAVRRAEA
jgi:phosphoribosylanthranilate isomerase